MKKIFRSLPYLLVLLLGVFAYFRSDEFSIDKLSSDLSYQRSWALELPGDEILEILDQDFHYLDSGRQCFVFASADGKYVIKFLNHARFSMSPFLRMIPLPEKIDALRQKKIETREKRIDDFFNSFAIGYEFLREETKILFMQLMPQDVFSKPLSIFDVSGHVHKIDLNQVNFTLQRKVDAMIYPYLNSLKTCKDFERALTQIIALVAKRIEKGIMDDDLNVEVNIGFLENAPVMIDVGRLFLDEDIVKPENFKRELDKSTRFIQTWLFENHPHMIPFFEREKAKLLESRSDRNAFSPSAEQRAASLF